VRRASGAFFAALLVSSGCERAAPAPQPPAPKALAPEAPRSATPPALAKVEPVAQLGDRASAERAIAQLTEQLATPAGDPENPWALAHGLLAFGKDYKTSDGRSALRVAASYAEPKEPKDGPKPRYGFPLARGGKPVEPHAYLLVKTFLELGLAPSFSFTAADGAKIDLRRLLTDMRASVREPTSDAQWHDAAWWLSALELHAVPSDPELVRLREAALARLEADDAVLEADAAEPFAPSAPMGAAKRNKSHIYGHPCGGLHFVQAVLRGASATGDSGALARVHRQLGLLLRRYDAERNLYGETLRAHPEARLLVSGQQLKFFGHLLETLALADQLGLLRADAALAEAVTSARRRAASDLLRTLAQLEQERAYPRLAELTAQRPQLALDLIGDGCHALHGLRVTLPVLP